MIRGLLVSAWIVLLFCLFRNFYYETRGPIDWHTVRKIINRHKEKWWYV